MYLYIVDIRVDFVSKFVADDTENHLVFIIFRLNEVNTVLEDELVIEVKKFCIVEQLVLLRSFWLSI